MKKATYGFLIANLIGILLLLYFDHRVREFARSEQRHYFDFGDNLNFFLTAFPVFLACVAGGCAWCVASLLAAFRRRSYQESSAFCTAVAVWIGVLMATGHQNLIINFPTLAGMYLRSLWRSRTLSVLLRRSANRDPDGLGTLNALTKNPESLRAEYLAPLLQKILQSEIE